MNISKIHNCYGCGLCAKACAKNIIEIIENNKGFYEPKITDINKCSNCGLCVDVCAFSHDEIALHPEEINYYAAWSKNAATRNRCSSGGVGFEIGKYLISKGYKVCAVKYNVNKNRAEHYIATTVDELMASTGSKYIQSYTVDGFLSINRQDKYLVTGSPCQIDSFRRFIRRMKIEDNFILMDFFCHGVPSKIVWDAYIEQVKYDFKEIESVDWRNKTTGWHDSWAMTVKGVAKEGCTNQRIRTDHGDSTFSSRLSQGDFFYKMFLSDACLGKACYDNCKYKGKSSSADIRIGDLWGTKYAHDELGVNGVITFTEKGKAILNESFCELKIESFDVITESQMKKPPLRNSLYYKIEELIETNSFTFDKALKLHKAYSAKRYILWQVKRPFHFLSRHLKKIFVR